MMRPGTINWLESDVDSLEDREIFRTKKRQREATGGGEEVVGAEEGAEGAKIFRTMAGDSARRKITG